MNFGLFSIVSIAVFGSALLRSSSLGLSPVNVTAMRVARHGPCRWPCPGREQGQCRLRVGRMRLFGGKCTRIGDEPAAQGSYSCATIVRTPLHSEVKKGREQRAPSRRSLCAREQDRL